MLGPYTLDEDWSFCVLLKSFVTLSSPSCGTKHSFIK